MHSFLFNSKPKTNNNTQKFGTDGTSSSGGGCITRHWEANAPHPGTTGLVVCEAHKKIGAFGLGSC